MTLRDCLFVGLIFFGQTSVFSQSVDFSIPSTVCLQQAVPVSNTSSGITSYVWDFCQDGLLYSDNFSSQVIQTQSSIPVGIEVMYDKGNWYGFVCGRENASTNKIVRLSFGTSLGNTPTILSDYPLSVNSLLSGASDIKFIYQGGNWFGFVANYYSNNIVRLDFGASLSNDTPSAVNMGNPAGWNGLYGLDIISSGNSIMLAGVGNSSNSVSVINYTNTITTNSPVASAVSTTTSSDNSLISSPVKIAFQQESTDWYALFTSLNGKVVRLSYGADPMSTPSISSVADISSASALQFKRDGANYFAFVQNSQGTASRLFFGNTPSNSPAVDQLSNFGTGNAYGLTLVKEWPGWKAFYVEVGTGKVYRLNFTDKCASTVSVLSSTQQVPLNLNYTVAGAYTIELLGLDANLNRYTKELSITVNNQTSPTLDFTASNNCLGSSTGFTATNSQSLNSISWSFGDGATSTQISPSHVYSSVGSYNAALTATASNGCSNTAQKTIQIFNPPQAAFSLPTVNPFCTGQNYVFTNTSTSDTGSNPTWQWNVNGSDVSTNQDLTYQFPSAISQSVKLTASIPGCSTQSTQTISSVSQGPILSFSAPGTSCVNGTVSFTNTSSGSISGNYNWTFGDGNSSTQTNPANTYLSNGVFNVTLSASNAAGCQNSFSKTLSVYTNPQPNFSVDLPPFSCAGSATQFNDLTPTLSDSNLSSWNWQFGDANGGVSQARNPAYTYATATNYNVSLQVTSNFGCAGSVQKSITISPSPQAAFTNTAACINQVTQFTDASTGNIKSRQWKIQGNTLTSTNPTYTFLSSSIFPVTLTVTGNNNCIGQVTQNIVVPVAPVMDFSVLYPCTGTTTQFQEVNSGGSDPATAWNWNFTVGSGSGNPTSYSFPSAGSYTVTLASTRQSKCVYSVSKNIAIVNGPIAAFTPSVSAGAAPLNVSFTNSSTSATSYAWSFGDAGNSSSTNASPSFVFSELGNYNVRLVASNSFNCTSTANALIKVVVPSVDAYLSSFVLADDQTTSSKRAVVTIVNKGNVPLINPVVKVNLGGNVSVKEAVPETIQAGGSIARTLNMEIVPTQISYVCALVDVANDIFEGNNEQCVTLSQEEVVLSPYPNPATSEFSIDWVTPSAQQVRVMVFKMDGRLVFEQTLESPVGLTQFKVNSSSWANGLYVVRVAGAQSQKVYKVVIAN
jgi:PKD repeat protein